MSLSPSEKRLRLEKALLCGGGTHTVEDMLALVKEGRAQFWEGGDGAIITEIHSFPRLRAVHFWTISGVLRDCLDLEDDIVRWALAEGCSVATACGRPGWGKVAPNWRPWWPTFWRPLTAGATNYGSAVRR